MVDIVFKRRKENSKSRRMRERGEHYAAYKALCDADRLMARKLEAAFTKLSEGCTAKVARAINGPSVRDVKEVEFVTRENPQYRKVKNPYGQHINARQKMRGHSIPLI